jgi:Rieske Fe-S protein
MRREFVKGVAATAALAGCGGSVTGPLSPPDAPPRILRTALMAVGETVSVADGDSGIAVTRISETRIVAVSRTCTHQGCTVLLPEGRTTLDCPCHGSRFTTLGAVVNGPASRPLPSYPARIEGTEVTITVT